MRFYNICMQLEYLGPLVLTLPDLCNVPTQATFQTSPSILRLTSGCPSKASRTHHHSSHSGPRLLLQFTLASAFCLYSQIASSSSASDPGATRLTTSPKFSVPWIADRSSSTLGATAGASLLSSVRCPSPAPLLLSSRFACVLAAMGHSRPP